MDRALRACALVVTKVARSKTLPKLAICLGSLTKVSKSLLISKPAKTPFTTATSIRAEGLGIASSW